MAPIAELEQQSRVRESSTAPVGAYYVPRLAGPSLEFTEKMTLNDACTLLVIYLLLERMKQF
jgi:hypothetical protein